MHLANYLGYLHKAELNLAEGFRKVAAGHAEEADVYYTCYTLAKQCESHAEQLEPFTFQVRRDRAQPSDVSAGARQARHDA